MNTITIDSCEMDLREFYLSLNSLLRERGMAPLANVRVRWSEKMASALGKTYARWDTDWKTGFKKLFPTEIVLNRRYFRKNPNMALITSVIRHEAAHVWTICNCGRLDHSHAWSHVAKILGDNGRQYADGDIASEVRAVAEAQYVPTHITNLSPRNIHALRTSLKQICLKYHVPYNLKSFNQYVRPRFPQFATEAMDGAAEKLFV